MFYEVVTMVDGELFKGVFAESSNRAAVEKALTRWAGEVITCTEVPCTDNSTASFKVGCNLGSSHTILVESIALVTELRD